MATKNYFPRLLLMRHAKSDWATSDVDKSRPLSKRGVKDALKMGKWFLELRLPSVILCSAAQRATETLKNLEIGSGLDLNPITEVLDDLYNPSFDSLRDIIQSYHCKVDLMVIGHNPGLEQLLLWLLESTQDLEEYEKPFPTGAFYELSLKGGFKRLDRSSAELISFIRPKLI